MSELRRDPLSVWLNIPEDKRNLISYVLVNTGWYRIEPGSFKVERGTVSFAEYMTKVQFMFNWTEVKGVRFA